MVQIAAFYHFGRVPTESLEELRQKLENFGRSLDLKGLVIFATEGLNGTVCAATQEQVLQWLAFVSQTLDFPVLDPKWSEANEAPFRRFGVRIRDEIVTLGKPEVQPLSPKSETHLSPDQWDEMMKQDNVVLVDTRNWYETRIGTFKGAVDPKIDEFSDFSKYVKDQLQAIEISTDKKIMIFCTGGIRCEKAIVEMRSSGFEQVYQLDGGILNYLAQKPNAGFEGECFVFDNRVAVDQMLKPSVLYTLCPHCGQPADQKIDCTRCETNVQICVSCLSSDPAFRTCSKNCANHYRLAPGKKGKSQDRSFRPKTQS